MLIFRDMHGTYQVGNYLTLPRPQAAPTSLGEAPTFGRAASSIHFRLSLSLALSSLSHMP